MYFKKSRPATFSKKKKSFTKPRRTRKSSVRRVPKVRVLDPTVVRINPGKDPIIYLKKSLRETSPYSAGVLGTNGMYFTSLSSLQIVTGQLLFDPSGNYGNNSYTLIGGFPFQGPVAIPEWNSYAGLYQMYKVTKITARFSAVDSGNLDVGSPVVYVRYNTKYNASIPTTSELSTQRGLSKN